MRFHTIGKYSAALAALIVAPIAVAESGTYDAIFSAVANYTQFEHAGGTVIGGSSIGTNTITRSSGVLFAEGSSATVRCILYAKKSAQGMDLESACTSTASNGDQIFSLATRKVGDTSAGGGGTGTNEIIGGTGRYVGISGTCSYKVDYLPENRFVSASKCRWQK